MYPGFLIAGLIAFSIRWALNWRILNKQNNTNYSFFYNVPRRGDYFSKTKHVFVSEWILYWSNDERNKLKTIANVFSAITIVLSLLALVAFFYES